MFLYSNHQRKSSPTISKLQPPTEKEIALIKNLRLSFATIPKVEKATDPTIDSFWIDNIHKLNQLITTEDPRSFLTWDMIKYTMFVSGSVPEELTYLKQSPLFETRWKDAIQESHLGQPQPYKHYPSSSGNLIHHAPFSFI